MVDDHDAREALRRVAEAHTPGADPAAARRAGDRRRRRQRTLSALGGAAAAVIAVVGSLVVLRGDDSGGVLDVVAPSTSAAPSTTAPSSRACTAGGLVFDVPLGWIANNASSSVNACTYLRPLTDRDPIGFYADLAPGEPADGLGPLTVSVYPGQMTAALGTFVTRAGWDGIVIDIADGALRTIPDIDGVTMRLVDSATPTAVAVVGEVRRVEGNLQQGQLVAAIVFATSDPNRVVIISSVGTPARSPADLTAVDAALTSIARSVRLDPAAPATSTTRPAPTSEVCRSERFEVTIPAGWYTNRRSDQLWACAAWVNTLAPGVAVEGRYFTWPAGVLDFDGIPIVIDVENATPAAIARGEIFAWTRTEADIAGTPLRLARPVDGVSLDDVRLADGTIATRLRIVSRNAIDGTPDGTVVTVVIVDAGDGTSLMARIQPRAFAGDEATLYKTFTEITTSLRLTTGTPR